MAIMTLMLKKIHILKSKRKLMLISLLLCGTILSTSALAMVDARPEIVNSNDATLDTAMDESDPKVVNKNGDSRSPSAKADEKQPSQAGSTAAPQKNTQPAPPVAANTPPGGSPSAGSSVQVDEQFNGTSLNTALWEPISYPKGYRNNEEQDYRPSQVRVADGTLQLTATRDSDGQWHSGEVHSKWNYLHGDFEVRVAMSATGPGVWPAAWLMGTTDHWPNGGEIDIYENVNGSNMAHGTIHGGGSSGHWQLPNWYSGINPTQFHTFKIVKRPGVISWWVDGIKRAEWTQSQIPSGGSWPFENYRNFGLLNLAIGGNWPGPSNASTPSNLVMYVDYFTVKNAW